MKAHMGQMPRRWDVQPRRNESADVVATTADPILFVIGGQPTHDDPVPAFQIRHGLKQWRIAGVIKGIRAGHVIQRIGHVDDCVFGNQGAQGCSNTLCVKVVHRLAQRRDQGFVGCVYVVHSCLIGLATAPLRARHTQSWLFRGHPAWCTRAIGHIHTPIAPHADVALFSVADKAL